MESFGWGGFFIAMAACGAISTALLVPLWRVRNNPKLAEAEKEEAAAEAS